MLKKGVKDPAPKPPPQLKNYANLIVFLSLLVLLISTNTQHISDRMFWLDEAYTFYTVTLPIDIIEKKVAGTHMQPPLFYWFGHAVAGIGTDPVTLRSLSVAIYILMIGFAFYSLRELTFSGRVFLCFVIIMSPFGAYATTEFRPYALAAISILISSVLLYRALNEPAKWLPAILYGMAALSLQYSLTLNCFVFGLQIGFFSLNILYSLYKAGYKQTLKANIPLLIIVALLCVKYAFFLNIIWHSGERHYNTPPFDFSAYLTALRFNASILFEKIMRVPSWSGVFVIGSFLAGLIMGMLRHKWITIYLTATFIGQLLFSTFMTFSRIHWFEQRYLVACYIAFALICAMGAEYLFQCINKKIRIGLLVFLIGTALSVSIHSYANSFKAPLFNPSLEAIKTLRCHDKPTVVLTYPHYISKIPRYAYRNDPLIIVPKAGPDLIKFMLEAASKKYCFILQGQPQKMPYQEEEYCTLFSLSGYAMEKYNVRPGCHVPDVAWVFTPLYGKNEDKP